MSIKVEVFSTPGCSRCERDRESLRAVTRSFGESTVDWRDINVLDELDYAVELGVLVPPSMAIDGELVFPRLPSAEKLREELARRVRNRSA